MREIIFPKLEIKMINWHRFHWTTDVPWAELTATSPTCWQLSSLIEENHDCDGVWISDHNIIINSIHVVLIGIWKTRKEKKKQVRDSSMQTCGWIH